MATSFNGVTTFLVLADGVPRTSVADVSVRHMPGGSTTYVDIGGAQLKRLDLSLLFLLATDAISFEAQLGQVGTLVYADGTYQALLLTLSRTSRGLSTAGDTVMQAEFLLLT